MLDLKCLVIFTGKSEPRHSAGFWYCEGNATDNVCNLSSNWSCNVGRGSNLSYRRKVAVFYRGRYQRRRFDVDVAQIIISSSPTWNSWIREQKRYLR